MSENTRPDAAQTDETTVIDTDTAATADSAPETQPGANTDIPADGDTFPRSYVEDLRKESAGYRDRAKTAEDKADQLAQRLHAALVTATGRLENPADLDYRADHLDDDAALAAAIDALLADRPYMAKRVVAGDAGQGARGGNTATPSFADLLRG